MNITTDYITYITRSGFGVGYKVYNTPSIWQHNIYMYVHVQYMYMCIHSGIAFKVLCVHSVSVIHSKVTVLVTRCCNCSC